jgi:hypothetical protein
MIYGYLLIAITLFGSGYATAWKVGTQQIIALEAQIIASNADAQQKLLEAIEATERAEQAAANANIQLETEHEKNIEAITAGAGMLGAVRMRVPVHPKDCGRAVPKSAGAGVIEDSTDTAELPNDLTQLLRSETLRADNLAVYANEAYQYISTKCGIKQ